MLVKIYLSLGSNIMPDKNIDRALEYIKNIVKLKNISTVYKTEPLGNYSNYFYNCVIGGETDIDPFDLKKRTTMIEIEMGRKIKRNKSDDREIDIDILIYDDSVIQELGIPHHDIFEKPFIAAGLCEIAPDLNIVNNETACDISSKMIKAGMTPLFDYTNKLRAKYIYGSGKQF
jgi:2-amino-4-hydroxy-6-hydroxymethyldihydropteridine diphosphokinase